MRKTVAFLMLFIALVSCKSTSVTNTKLDQKTEVMLKGDWMITSVDFPGSDYLKVMSFRLDDSQCFVGSNWNFISNNNKGTMSLNNPNCPSFSSPITWYVNTDGNVVLKIINDYKAKNVNSGFILALNNLTENSFELVDTISVAGKTKNITYTFQRK